MSVPFDNAEEAWFWYLRVGEYVGKPRSIWPDDLANIQRPCEPHEIFREICLAYKAHVLTHRHMLVLAKTNADSALPSSRTDIKYFEGAMKVLQKRLERKGIIQREEKVA